MQWKQNNEFNLSIIQEIDHYLYIEIIKYFFLMVYLLQSLVHWTPP